MAVANIEGRDPPCPPLKRGGGLVGRLAVIGLASTSEWTTPLPPLCKGGRAARGRAVESHSARALTRTLTLTHSRGMGLASSDVEGTRGGGNRRAGPPLPPLEKGGRACGQACGDWLGEWGNDNE